MNQLEQVDLLTGFDTVATAHVASRSELLDVTDAARDDRWTDAIHNMLAWRKEAEEVCDDVWKSAIDFAVDQQDQGTSPPSSIATTDSGEVCFEWRTSRTVHIVTIVDSGVADFVFLKDGRVRDSGTLRRNPRTRKLELETEA